MTLLKPCSPVLRSGHLIGGLALLIGLGFSVPEAGAAPHAGASAIRAALDDTAMIETVRFARERSRIPPITIGGGPKRGPHRIATGGAPRLATGGGPAGGAIRLTTGGGPRIATGGGPGRDTRRIATGGTPRIATGGGPAGGTARLTTGGAPRIATGGEGRSGGVIRSETGGAPRTDVAGGPRPRTLRSEVTGGPRGGAAEGDPAAAIRVGVVERPAPGRAPRTVGGGGRGDVKVAGLPPRVEFDEYVRPIRPWVGRPHYGRRIGDIELGTIIVVRSIDDFSYRPMEDLCWYWVDRFRTEGYWDYCD
jgi:hypothetical protein